MIDTLSSPSLLAVRLRERIESEGPITFCEWMEAALYDQGGGYYCRSDRARWGREGDYRTSPERSGLFAATFARYFSRLYTELGSPSNWTILECGAGDGQFAEGLLQTLRDSFPNIFAVTTYVIDDLSSHSRALAEKRLQSFANRVEFKALNDVEIESGVVFSNELLDAFPVHRITMAQGRLREFYVRVDKHGEFAWKVAAPGPGLDEHLNKYFEEFGLQLAEGDIAEVSLETENWLRKVANALHNGYVVTVDYGASAESLFSRKDGTLRGFREHEFVDDFLAGPGEHDLTTTVNWSFVKSAGDRLGLRAVELMRQDKFLLEAGLLEQLELESKSCESEAQRLRISTAAREMILPDGMGAHFQVLVQQKT